MRTLLLTVLLAVLRVISIASVDINYVGQCPDIAPVVERRLEVSALADDAQSWWPDSVVTWLQLDGYLDAVAYWESGRLIVAAGRQCRLREIAIDGDSCRAVSLDLPFTQASIDSVLSEILASSQYESGHYFARATVTNVVRSGNEVSISVEINPGPRVSVSDFVFTGLSRSRPAVIRKYLDMATGDSLTQSGLNHAERDAAAIPFLRFRSPITVHPRPGFNEVDLEFTFAERPQFYLFGGAGYVPDDRIGLVWNLDMQLRNLFGGGREVSIMSERRKKDRYRLDIGYQQPLFLFGVGHLSFTASTRDYRDDFYEFSTSGSYSARWSHILTTDLAAGWRRVEPADSRVLVGERSYSAYSLEFAIHRSTISPAQNPIGGTTLDASVTYVHRSYSGSGSGGGAFNETRGRFSVGGYQSLLGRFAGHANINYAGIESEESELPSSELIFIGGSGTLRGYRNEQFAAQRTAFGTLEPRLLYGSGYLSVFCDAAYINRRVAIADGGSMTEELWRVGYGLGIVLSDSVRSVSISFGWGEDSTFDEPRLSIEFSSEL
ncbi:MAG: hypothetical protein DRP45_02580 [Candidatus Zixiibacteriota bacterium]|nr:MAG: hypothetical protein DRP45_02580 [candidate division Zixibacteria bacterium]